MGCLPWLCWKARSRVASSGCEAAGADGAAPRHAASRVDLLGRRSGSWSSGLWRMGNPSASDPAGDSAAHFQVDCKSTREAGASWNEATSEYDEARCRAALPEPHGSASAARPARPAPLDIQSGHAYRSRLGFFFALTKSIIEKGNCQVALSESYFFDFITLLTGTFVRNEAEGPYPLSPAQTGANAVQKRAINRHI